MTRKLRKDIFLQQLQQQEEHIGYFYYPSYNGQSFQFFVDVDTQANHFVQQFLHSSASPFRNLWNIDYTRDFIHMHIITSDDLGLRIVNITNELLK
jgi:hypothetical protein